MPRIMESAKLKTPRTKRESAKRHLLCHADRYLFDLNAAVRPAHCRGILVFVFHHNSFNDGLAADTGIFHKTTISL